MISRNIDLKTQVLCLTIRLQSYFNLVHSFIALILLIVIVSFISQRMSKRRNRYIQLCVPSLSQRRA